MLRFILSCVSLAAFFDHYYVSHKFSLACVDIQGFQNQELWLVDSTSVLVWLLLFPMLYMVSEVLCPKGGYTTTRNSVMSIFSRHNSVGKESEVQYSSDDNSSIGSVSISDISHETADGILAIDDHRTRDSNDESNNRHRVDESNDEIGGVQNSFQNVSISTAQKK